MKNKKFLFILINVLVFFVPTVMKAQSFTLHGRVIDESNNPIEFATVSCAKQGKMTMTSLKGEYTLQLHSADSVEIRFSMIGYRTKTRILRKPRGKQTLQTVLYSNVGEIEGVTVTGTKIQTGQMQQFKKDDIKNMPSVTGNAVEEMLQGQAGVSTHNELSSKYNVRGGSFDENSVYINNVEIYRPFLVRSGQQEGISIINPDMVEKIEFSTGGFEARYGDKMSSALNITYRQPSRFEASAYASLLGDGIYVGYGNKKFAWSNSVRYKTTRNLLGSLDTKGEYRPTFVDYQTYLTLKPNKRWEINILGNISNNNYNFYPEDRETRFGTSEDVKSFRVYFDGQEKDVFRTYFGSAGLTYKMGDATKLSLIASAFKTHEQERYDIQGQYWLTQTETSENLGVGTFFQHARNYLDAHVESLKMMFNTKAKKHDIEAAFTFKNEHVTENSAEYEMRDSSNYNIPHTGNDLKMIYSMRAKNSLSARRMEAYIQDTYRFTSPSKKTLYTLNYGVRISHWSYNKETIFSPRLSLGIIPAFNENVTMRLAAGLYYQSPFFKEIRDTSTVNGVTYATLNRKAKSQRSVHIIAGYDYRFKMNNRQFRFSAEAYYKILGNLIPYSVNNVKVVYYGGNECNGHAAGLDMKLYGEFVPGADSWLSFSLMNTSMKLNNKSIPLPTDQRFAISLFFTDYFPGTQRWKMSLKLAYADGLPFSAPHRELETNSFRAPAYKRVDMGLSYRLVDNTSHSSKHSTLRNVWLGVECLNLLGISNVNSYYWVTDVTAQQYAVPNYLTGRQLNFKVSVDL